MSKQRMIHDELIEKLKKDFKKLDDSFQAVVDDARKRIKTLDSAMQEFIDESNIAMVNSLRMRVFIFDQAHKFKLLGENGNNRS